MGCFNGENVARHFPITSHFCVINIERQIFRDFARVFGQAPRVIFKAFKFAVVMLQRGFGVFKLTAMMLDKLAA